MSLLYPTNEFLGRRTEDSAKEECKKILNSDIEVDDIDIESLPLETLLLLVEEGVFTYKLKLHGRKEEQARFNFLWKYAHKFVATDMEMGGKIYKRSLVTSIKIDDLDKIIYKVYDSNGVDAGIFKILFPRF